ncbi:PucR-like helix-turn-helix protein [Fontibacillus phaseoli]|uniref:PucR-like helix-turn-helix protein n=2 Tax=Fontibacillus phaseoli TaxID=1416533 RepID=A0A369BCZ1_9BACL|nr:PucR-like helix-turn-helix protein [Fontibacillus phaseoli]
MEINSLKQQVEQIVGIPLTVKEMEISQWESITAQAAKIDPGTFRLDDRIIWFCKKGATTVQVLEGDAARLTEKESKLIELLIAGTRETIKSLPVKKDEESRSVEIGEWIEQCLEQGELNGSVPENLALKSRLQTPMLPLLVSWENRAGQGVAFSKLHKLLRSYFGGELLLIPLKEDWLILVSEALLTDLREESEEGADNERDLLGALCQGLYELISNEWAGGGCHLAVHELITGDHYIAQAALTLRETFRIGHLFHIAEHIHLPWELQLERLICSIPGDARERFISETGGHHIVFADEEMLTTLETFFQMDCNVSETAKRLYIHRNTLMYRIDKIKQETGLDVRTFRDAVLINLELLLYKVTKRV